jgi:hypothetical protein
LIISESISDPLSSEDKISSRLSVFLLSKLITIFSPFVNLMHNK